MQRFSPHNHTEMSNFRILDAINKLKPLVQRGHDIGLAGMAITDHETIAQSIKICKLQKEYPDFKIAIGNEIYLTETRDKSQKYYHFILIAKDAIGHKQLRKLSSVSWAQSYYDRGLERVPTLKSELADVIKKEPGHILATSACIGGELSSSILSMETARKIGDKQAEIMAYKQIVNFMNFVDSLFGDDFYVEIAPGASTEQIIANKKLIEIAKFYNKKVVIGDDSHYYDRSDRLVHKAYLNSKGGERETDSFYKYAYLHDETELYEDMKDFTDMIPTFCENSMDMYDKIEIYDLQHSQTIPRVPVKDYPKVTKDSSFDNSYPVLSSMFNSDDIYERYWVNECETALKEKDLIGKPEYLDELEEEARVKTVIGKKLDTNMFSYPITLKYYIDMIWDCGSLVGAGRGSSCAALNHYLLGITQLDPIEWNLPFFRYMNDERIELGDIDIDICPSKKPVIVNKIKEERGQRFNPDIDDISRKNFGCALVATYGTEGSKSAVLTACRGYRSEEYPDGIDNDEAQYLASLIPVERGELWSISEVMNGIPEKSKEPIFAFINKVKEYPGLIDIIKGIEGLINKRSSHASGVILFDEDPFQFGCFMKTPKGEVITQYDLHDCEAGGLTKYDFLVTDVQDKLAQTMRFLQEDNLIEGKDNVSLRPVYDKYFHPNVLPLKDNSVWQAIQSGNILNVFQFDSVTGSQAAKKIKPSNILELTDANGLMRLMTAEKGAESPMEKYIRFKNNIDLWYQEMNAAGLTKQEMKTLEPYFKSSYGVPPSQEQLMLMLMDKDICGFTLKEANAARKVVSKKLVDKIPELKEKVLKQAKSSNLGLYVWKYGIGPQMGYSFSVIHALVYSFTGFQTAYIATKWNPIYWDTACLVVNSGSLEEEDIMEYDEDGIPVQQKEQSTDYTKIAKALNKIIEKGIRISLVDINKSDYGFKPDVENNQILFGMKALNSVGAAVVDEIKANRPYRTFKEFLLKTHLKKPAIISLIKAGAFDKIAYPVEGYDQRAAAMAEYLVYSSKPKTKLTLQNFNGLIEADLIPKELTTEKKTFLYNKILKKHKEGEYYLIPSDIPLEDFVQMYNEIVNMINGVPCVLIKEWDSIYQFTMDDAREWLKENQEEVLLKYNQKLFKEEWNKYAAGTISAWEMNALCFYYHKHELADVDNEKYGIKDFNTIPNLNIDYFWKRNGKDIPIYNITRIAGTVIGKNDTNHYVSLLTTTGVVTVKFSRDFYAMFKKQISEVAADGTKKVKEKSWFSRGTKLIVAGYRRDDTFVCKKYKNTFGHQLYRITEVNGKNLKLTSTRYGMVGKDDE